MEGVVDSRPSPAAALIAGAADHEAMSGHSGERANVLPSSFDT